MNTHDDDEHVHKTETFGVRVLAPDVVLMVLRGRHERFVGETPESQQHLVEVLGHWVDRWCDRRGLSFMNLYIGPVGGDNADAMVVAFLAAPDVPADWTCFAGVVKDVMWGSSRRSPSAVLLPLVDLLGGIEGMPDFSLPDTEPDEEAPKPN